MKRLRAYFNRIFARLFISFISPFKIIYSQSIFLADLAVCLLPLKLVEKIPTSAILLLQNFPYFDTIIHNQEKNCAHNLGLSYGRLILNKSEFWYIQFYNGRVIGENESVLSSINVET